MEQILNKGGWQLFRIDQITLSVALLSIDRQYPNAMEVYDQNPLVLLPHKGVPSPVDPRLPHPYRTPTDMPTQKW